MDDNPVSVKPRAKPIPFSRRLLVAGSAGVFARGTIVRPQRTAAQFAPGSSVIQVVLISEVDIALLPTKMLKEIAAAVNTQVVQDFTPIWGIDASVTAKTGDNALPDGAWKIIIKDDENIQDLHEYVTTGSIPGFGRAFIRFTEETDILTKAISHECLEMLCNPFLTRFHFLPSLQPDQGFVLFPQEICDPCMSSNSGYRIGPILLSDFATPDYYQLETEPKTLHPGTKYSFAGSLTLPREVAMDGYLDWVLPASGMYWRATRTSSGLQLEESPTKLDGWIVDEACAQARVEARG